MFKFTIRELLLLTLVVALAVGWWLDRSRLTNSNTRLKFISDSLLTHLQIREGDELYLMLPDGTTWPEGANVK